MAEAEKAGVEAAGGSATIYQYALSSSHPTPLTSNLTSTRIAETLPQEVLTLLHAPPKGDYPILEPSALADFDAFLIGIPTRFGNFPGQWKAFWDATGQLWAQGKLAGKFGGLFISTAGQGGGQECTFSSSTIFVLIFTHRVT